MNTKITIEGNGTMENALKVAFATKDMEEINAHFGGAKEFVVYNVSKDGFSLSEVIKTDTNDVEDDDKTDFRVRALKGINIMYCESIGGTAAAKVYVKVFARMQDGQIQFYKDGYTDLRGWFDYATLSTDALPQVQQFAILVLSEQDGAVVREVNPPKQ